MVASISEPGVEVKQEFKTVSPTAILPTLVPCVVGVCRQVVDVQRKTSAGGTELNSDALLPFPANFLAKAATGNPPAYTGLAGLLLVLEVNNGAPVTVTFAGTSLSPKAVVAQILAAFAAAGVTEATAEVVGTSQFRVRSVAANEFQSIHVAAGTSPAVLSAFGIGAGRTYSGAGSYSQYEVPVSIASYPDPRRNLAEVTVEPSSVRAFLYLGGTNGRLQEVHRDRAFLRRGVSGAAVVTGSADISALTYGVGATLGGKTLIVTFDDGSLMTVTFAVAVASVAAAIAAINAVIGSVGIASLTPANHLVITSLSTGVNAKILVGAGTANGNLGLSAGLTTGTAAIRSIASGSGSAVTPFLEAPGQNFTDASTAAVLTGTTSIAGGVPDGQTLILDDGTGPQTLTFSGAVSSVLVLAAINALYGTAAGGYITASVNGSTYLVLTSSRLGAESTIKVLGGTGLAALGLTVSSASGGVAPAVAGDELYVNGSYFAKITQVAPGGNSAQLKIDKQVGINANLGSTFYIVAKSLPAAGRPTPDLQVGSDGSIVIKADLLRDVTGSPMPSSRAQVYLAYKGIRRDVTAVAKNASLLAFSDTSELASQLSPVSAENPLALGTYFALLNSPGRQVTALGIDSVSDASPYGTVDAYARAASFLESREVYALAPMTNDPTVGQIFSTHVSFMSQPEQKGNRMVFLNSPQPTHQLDTLVTSGTDGDSLGSSTFDTKVANLGALLLAQGLSPSGAIAAADGLFLDVGDGKSYSISSVAGSVVTTRSSFTAGENDDSFYATVALPDGLISSGFAVRVRGAALVLTDGLPDKDKIAATYNAMGTAYSNRRVRHIVADTVAASIDNLEQKLPGFYLAAAYAGLCGSLPAQQSHTNYPVIGFTRVFGTNDYFSNAQMNVIAGGGNFIVAQGAAGTPLFSRMALTTDVTSIETRTDSINTVVDYAEKFFRTGVKIYIGRYNITSGFLDSLSHVIQGLADFLIGTGVLEGFTLDRLIQDVDRPDGLIIDCLLKVPYPCNYIRLTLTV